MLINLDDLFPGIDIVHQGKTHKENDFLVSDFLKYAKEEKEGKYDNIIDQTKALCELIYPTVDVNTLTTQQRAAIHEICVKRLNGEIDKKKLQGVLKPQE